MTGGDVRHHAGGGAGHVPSARPPLTWLVTVVAVAAQTVTLVVTAVVLRRHASHIDLEREAENFTDFVLLDFVGPFAYTVAAVAVGVVALLLAAALLLLVLPGSNRTVGLVVGLTLQAPTAFFSFRSLADGPHPRATVIAVGSVVVIVAALVPATWRWCRRPRPGRPVDTGGTTT